MSASMRRLWVQLTADRRRFSLLCAVCAVGLLLWGRLIVVSRMPRTAVADTSSAASASAAGKTATGEATRANEAGVKAADKSGAKGDTKARRSVPVRLASRCERDPFVISPVFFPKAKPLGEVKQEQGKLPTEPAEDSTQKETRLVARLTELLGPVRLEVAMGNSMAVIGGRLYRVGERLPALGPERVEFTLVEVRERSVVLEFQSHRFEVQMSRPGGGDGT